MTARQYLPIVNMASPNAVIGSFRHERHITSHLPQLVADLRTAIEEAGLWVLHEIDPQALLRKGGFTIPAARQILFFHPGLMVRLLEEDSAAILEVPLKFAVLEQADQVRVSWLDPETAFARYGNDKLTGLGQELGRICHGIVDSAEGNIHKIAA